MTRKEKIMHGWKRIITSISQSEEPSKSIRIPVVMVKYTVGVLCVLVVVITGAFLHYQQVVHTANAQKAELEVLRQNRDTQVEKIEQLSKAAISLQADMDRLNSLEAELRRMVGNEDSTTTSRAGMVRPSAAYSVKGGLQLDINDIDNVVTNLQASVKVREESLIELKQELLAKQERLAARPSIWPTAGEVTSRFGWRGSPTGGRGSDYHPGIDISTSIGTPVVATADGQVVESGWYGGYGQMIQIDHGNGIATIYGHNSQLIVQVGQVVKKGQLIAYSGNTGYSTGPHVHYEVRVNGTAVNPASFLN